ncbi:MAG TPA: hypothetical protein PLG50_15675 [bacterium]|nr:hypothetical protein [bacterium]HQG47099.1 hypothetical protein [bacterium]HQI47289.1 hypothetical protein [bacterium]HQJ63776.1 hypothetical protein [bacterium]
MDIHDRLYRKVGEKTPFLAELWEPRETAVVIGHGQRADQEVHLEACRRDGVAVIRRRGGGGAVVLMPGVLCLSCAFISGRSDSPYFFFQVINAWLIAFLQREFDITGAEAAGISDIAVNGQKILGCSMFKSRNLFFYQGSLLVHPDLSRIALYLAHPTREPGYRRLRGHADFVTSLQQLGRPISAAAVKDLLEAQLEALRALLL